MIKKYWGGIEGGGTKFNCIVGSGPDDIVDEIRISTTSPLETLKKVASFFQKNLKKNKIASIGLGSFGPIDLNSNSETYGYITNTPKSTWSNTDILGILKSAVDVPFAFDTDVNAAALGEFRWGAAKGLDTFVYLTIGTGIGGGGMVNGQLMHGMLHPEMGHMHILHDTVRDPFVGICEFHGNCFEGLASGSAMKKRWHQPAEQLPTNHPAWKLEADYLAAGLMNLILILSPERIILGGSVMNHTGLIDMVRVELLKLLNGYVDAKELSNEINKYIVLPSLGDSAGRYGALALAQDLDRIGSD